jgi:PAS domain S-box-containing protein
MSYVTIVWSAAAAGALMLALVHGLVWAYDRRARANLAFAVAGLGLAAMTITELGMMHARTPQEFGQWLWWTQPPLFLLVCGIAVFLRLYLQAGRWQLLVTLVAARALVLLVNFFSDPNVNFERIDAIERIAFLGEEVAILTSAVPGRHQWFASFATVLFPLFIIDVVVTLWRRGTAEARRMALLIGGPVLLSVALSALISQLVIWQVAELPTLLIPPFFICIGAMALELSRELLRASRLARDLRESEQRLELAANAAGAGLWAWDRSTRRLWVTERARSILGVQSAGEVDAEEILQRVDPDDAPQLTASLRESLERGVEHAAHFRLQTPDGVRWIAAQGAVELDPRGKPALMRGVVRDVSQQRRAEEEASDLRRKLAHAGRVTMLGQLASALAHELSQPLSAIQHNAETAHILLRRDPVDIEELRAIVADVLRDDRRAAEVVHRLRTWLKQGRMNAEPISLEPLVQEVLALVRMDATAKHVTLECAVSPSLPPVFGDRVQLSQVLLNLVMNAMDATLRTRDARRRVLIEARLDASGECEISVSDTGPGIPPDQLDEIFEAFFTSKAEGMGVGLSISRAIVEAHGGRLWAENGARGGATFRFTTPLRAGALRQPA